MAEAHDRGDAWHLDRKIPIGLFVTIIIQTIVVLYVGTTWKSDVDHRLSNLEATAAHDALQEQSITILKTQAEHTLRMLDRLEALITRLDGKIDSKLQLKESAQ